MDVPASWIQVSLGSTRALRATYYALRHGGIKADYLRSWCLQGSNDGRNWTTLRRHVNDTSLQGAFGTASWPIPDCNQSFRNFRVLQTGHNSSNNNFLCLSGIELYGDLFEDQDKKNEGYISP